MKILVIDVGGTHVKLLATGQSEKREFSSGPTLTPDDMVKRVLALTADWPFDAVTVGYPGPVLHHHIVAGPHNLGTRWMGFDFQAAFGCRVKIINDAAMQALGGYQGGKMLFLGFGTGLGTALIVDGAVEPMELGHLPFKKSTYENYVSDRALAEKGLEKWLKHVYMVIETLRAALQADEVLLGGGNVRHITELPPQCRRGENADAFTGGFRMWQPAKTAKQGSIRIST